MEIESHAYKRAKQRCGLNKGSFRKMVDKAVEANITHGKTKNHMFKWISKIVMDHKNRAKVLVYDKYILLTLGDNVISVYQLPNNLLPSSNYIKKDM